jgi:hypothetical protein
MLAASIARFGRVVVASTILLCLNSSTARAKQTPGTVDFERQVMGLFGRMGCNAASCHGSFQGRGGFRLSLFGYDPQMDYLALTRDVLARRINAVDPDQSLILLKATGQIEHGGGRRFSRGSWQYRLLRDWIVAGAPWRPGSGTVMDLVLSPAECDFSRTGQKVRVRVRARFGGGAEKDVSDLCEFRVHDDAVASVTPEGEVQGRGPGDTVVVVSYRGTVRPLRVLVAREQAPGAHFPDLPEANYVDREVFAKLRRLRIVPSEPADDAEFLRRVTIDTIGSLPSPDEIRAFLADRSPDKRAEKIDHLLTHPLHAALWATKFCDITGNNTDVLEPPADQRSQMWHAWFRKRLADNRPYDEIVHGVLCATSRDGLPPDEWMQQVKALDAAALKGDAAAYADRPSLDLYWRRVRGQVPIDQWGEKTAAAFLGIRLECAQCHKHPYDRWTQRDYRAYANIFGQVRFDTSPETKDVITAENAERRKAANGKKQGPLPPVREVYVSVGKVTSLPDPETKRPLRPKALGGPEIKGGKGQDFRVALFEWLRSSDNPYFARSFVNRVWGHYFGVGLVDPVDNFALGNPPSNEKLLDALARDFVAHHYDIRHIERTILLSRTYQLSSDPNATNRLDHRNYSHSLVRPLMAEVVVDVINAALGVDEVLGVKGAASLPRGTHAIEMGATRVLNGNLAYAFRIFGRPPRTSACDCERAADPALAQVLYRMTDPALLAKLKASRATGRLHALVTSGKADGEILEDLFLATLSRRPTAAERRHFENYRAAKMHRAPNPPVVKGKGAANALQRVRESVFEDTLWALINTREFILNH